MQRELLKNYNTVYEQNNQWDIKGFNTGHSYVWKYDLEWNSIAERVKISSSLW
jgi:hypothetical protein